MVQPRLFGILKFLLKLVFLLERLLKARFLRRISLKEETLVALVDAPYVWRRKNMWIISLCIVGGSRRCGICLSLSLMGIIWVQPSNVRDVVVA